MIELKPEDFAEAQVTVCPPGRRSGVKISKPSAKTHHVPGSYKRPRPDPTQPPSKVWYAVICNPGCEGRAMAGLDPRVFRAYAPKRAVLTRAGGVKKEKAVIERPLFPRYIFVASQGPAMPFYKLRGINGIESLVRVDGQALSIPHRVIKAIMERDDAGEFDQSGVPRTLADVGLTFGEEMRVKEGIFEGIKARIRALMPNAHAEVLIHMFGRENVVSIDLTHLEKVEEPEKAA